MTALLLERPAAIECAFEHCSRDRPGGAPISGRADAHGRLTLDDLITSVWKDLSVRATVACPVCEGPMVGDADDSRGDSPMGGCLNCGSQLI